MSKLPSIPEFASTPEEISAALRAIKQTVELLAGLRQGESRGSPQVFAQPTSPKPTLTISYRVGDFWIDTSSNKLNFWNGQNWTPFDYT